VTICELSAKPHKKAAFAVELILADLRRLSKMLPYPPPTESGIGWLYRVPIVFFDTAAGSHGDRGNANEEICFNAIGGGCNGRIERVRSRHARESAAPQPPRHRHGTWSSPPL